MRGPDALVPVRRPGGAGGRQRRPPSPVFVQPAIARAQFRTVTASHRACSVQDGDSCHRFPVLFGSIFFGESLGRYTRVWWTHSSRLCSAWAAGRSLFEVASTLLCQLFGTWQPHGAICGAGWRMRSFWEPFSRVSFVQKFSFFTPPGESQGKFTLLVTTAACVLHLSANPDNNENKQQRLRTSYGSAS